MSTRRASTAEAVAPARARQSWDARLRRFEGGRAAWFGLGALMVAMAVLVFHETRDTNFWVDEWSWALERRTGGIGTFLEPHNQHLSIVPLAIYRVLFATVGLDDYTAYRLIAIAGHMAVAALLFAYARRRVGHAIALLVSALFLFFGPGWQNFMWGFQIAWLVALGAGVGALLLLDRRDRAGDLGASALLALGLASAGVAVPIVAGAACDVLFGRRRWKDLWIVAAPVALYGIWSLAYQDSSEFTWHAVVLVPGFVADSIGATVSSLVGLGVSAVPDRPGTTLEWANPLAVAAAAAVVWRLRRLGTISPRVVTLLAILGGFFVLTGLSRSDVSSPATSRYLYVGALFALLLACELGRGYRPGARALAVLAALTAIALVANVGVLRNAGRYLRGDAQISSTAVGAMEVARPVVDPGYVSNTIPGFPFLVVRASDYLEVADELGSPGAAPAEIAAAPEPVRRQTDAELIRMHAIDLPSAPARGASDADPPRVEEAAGGTAVPRGSCLDFQRPGFLRRGQATYIDVAVPANGVVVSGLGGDATVALRRFAAGYGGDQVVGTVGPRGERLLSIRPDADPRPWHLRLTPDQGARVCAA